MKKQRESLKEVLFGTESFCKDFLAILNSSMPCILITGFIIFNQMNKPLFYGISLIVPFYLLIFTWGIWFIPTYMKIKRLELKNKKMVLCLIVIYVVMMVLFTIIPFIKS
ncbi:hypothetical protein [Gilliamella apis]|uniref:hypothetical protein n=1 Tax=Gilliamella apis TaxID=1970738 RepID=UPI002740B367|nr:hypothetical protein [Gilliamella apis]WLT05871.1 hypothetical protein RAM11_08345 [Gilliamella apis]